MLNDCFQDLTDQIFSCYFRHISADALDFLEIRFHLMTNEGRKASTSMSFRLDLHLQLQLLNKEEFSFGFIPIKGKYDAFINILTIINRGQTAVLSQFLSLLEF